MEPSLSTGGAKLRLMCSYGGQIIPRPQTKSLFYAGGDTRIITLPTTAANPTLPTLAAHLAASLRLGTPFTLKYQLPFHDLDSLITLSTDEDVAIMLDEHNRVFPAPARIRLFVFPAKSATVAGAKPASNAAELSGGGSELTHPKKESWFVDVFESAKIMQRGGGAGYAGEGHSNNGCEPIVGICGAESMALETSSSFGSTSSSTSSSNLPARAQIDECGARPIDNSKLKLSSPESILSDRGLGGTMISQPHQDSAGFAATMDGKVATNHSELEGDTHRAVQASTFQPSFQFDQPRQVHYVHSSGLQYAAPNPAGVMQMQMPSYYMMNNPPLSQQPVYYHQTNQPQPIYFVPATQTYSNAPMQSGLVSSSTGNLPPLHPSSSMSPAQVSYKVAPASSPQELGLPMNLQTQPASAIASSVDKASYRREEDDGDATHAQIYKSQPPPPPAALQSQYQTLAKGTTTMLADALAQLHTDNIKPPLISQ
ncbi:unnamed protein product [Linum tenue]|uniref:PB1 domain-containing protein n=1 Tax=Linum tenue TaxID=586396 RepID=A0AAV0QQU6_9ROSI|nr:unnamed protein product [Linum tenue]